MLNTYLLRTQQLLQYPAVNAAQLYSTADLTTWINIARGQLAGETHCCRALGTLTTTIGVRNYNYSSISLPAGNNLGGVITARQMQYAVAQGYQWMRPRAWAWYWFYSLNNPVPTAGPPAMWSVFQPGAGGIGPVGGGTDVSGSFYIGPQPDLVYSLLIDCACYPASLVLDADVEAIPFLYTDAVPYFAAYLALLSAQSDARIEQAQKMFSMYQMFVQRADAASAPSVNKHLYERQDSPTSIGKLGLVKSSGGE